MANELMALATFNGVEIKARPSDHYIDVTAMCQANDRKWSKYAESVGAKRFLKALSSVLRNPEDALVCKIIGGLQDGQHTFAHRRIALHCAAWISAEFEQWVYEKVERLMTTGRVELLTPSNPLRALRLIVDAMEVHEQRLEAVESRVGVIELTREEAVLELRTVERAESSAPSMTTRDKINQLVRAYCTATSAAHAEVWIRLYKELFYRCDFNAQLRAKNAGKSALDCVEEAGLMSDLYGIASEKLIF